MFQIQSPYSGPEYGKGQPPSLWGSFTRTICNQEIVWGKNPKLLRKTTSKGWLKICYDKELYKQNTSEYKIML